MPILSSKRQITLPANQCEELGIQPGDEVECFVADGQITIIKKIKGSAEGILSHIKPQADISDDESLQSGLQ
ncbi:AbrB/MazE/SpoVT family DNA-binding domain-containing protein [Endozoicomonas sp. SESOKO1]|uniref:AbrB/MazE/SpoVT family DNA-binding domain-containing protein n=1 Tax=Endozoicomonas sp. SESOKO1 TaxID=2828742 RepID=UPI002148269F|nr:AbrB/MazE/SpoVT family DNA-binding domain-containing protein [Endozoicomonas sp. SESOKO1]